MSLHLDERAGGDFALFIDGDLQFDTADEALYHESMVLPALCLARAKADNDLRVLICGGGDGLALRECLRFPGVSHADLVDYDPAVVDLGRTRFAEINARAFEDPRASVHIADAWEFLKDAEPYDVVLCDFTVPRRPEDERVFSWEWYGRIGQALKPLGVAALNALSPQNTPEAFWSLRRTVQAAGLHALPYRVCIPSFRAQGYGAWAFMLAAHSPLHQAELRWLESPVETRQADLSRLWRGAHFSRSERRIGKLVPIGTLAEPCLVRLMLNPGEALKNRQAQAAISDFPPMPDDLYDLNPLLRSIPIAHPYHTREMIETLAQQVVGTVKSLDTRRLIEALLRRAADLPSDLVRELSKLAEFLRAGVRRFDSLGAWGSKLFVTLVILMTLANSIAPDNAFAKGAAGLGHAGMSRGYSSGFTHAGSSSFGGERGIGGSSAMGAARTSSFGGERGAGSSFGTGRSSASSFAGAEGSAHLSGSGFRSSYGSGKAVDVYGNAYSTRSFRYSGDPGYFGGTWHGYGGYHGGTSSDTQAPAQEHKAIFVADDDMMVLENGDVAITVSDNAYLLVSESRLTLMRSQSPTPLMPLFPDPELFRNIVARIQDQLASVRREADVRRDWVSWVGWTSALFETVRDDKKEIANLEDLQRRLTAAASRIKPPTESSTASLLPANSTELFVEGFLLPDRRIALLGPDGKWLYTDGKQVESEDPGVKPTAAPKELTAAITGVLAKLRKELAADMKSDDDDIRDLNTERSGLQSDLAEYQQIYSSNGYQGDYEVDYGTDSIPVSEAISRTQQDLDQNQQTLQQTTQERDKQAADLASIDTAIRSFGQ